MNLKLGRKKDYRDQLLKNLACSLIEHKRIKTTHSKARLLKGYMDELFNLASANSYLSFRELTSRLNGKKDTAKKIISFKSDILKERHSGTVKIVKLGQRLSDGSEMVIVELTKAKENKDAK